MTDSTAMAVTWHLMQFLALVDFSIFLTASKFLFALMVSSLALSML